MSNITLNTKVYVGQGVVNALATWLYSASGVFSGFDWVKARVNASDPKFIRVKWTGSKPVVATSDSSCACNGEVLRFSDFDITIRCGRTSTTAERTDLALAIKDLTATTEFQDSIINYKQPQG